MTDNQPTNGAAVPNCGNCHFSRMIISNTKLVSCCAEPPRVQMFMTPKGPGFATEFPSMRREQWCGKHQHRNMLQRPQVG